MAGREYHNQPNYHDTRLPRESTSRDRNDNREAIARRDSNGKPHWKSAPTAESHGKIRSINKMGAWLISGKQNRKRRCQRQAGGVCQDWRIKSQDAKTRDSWNSSAKWHMFAHS